MRRAASELPPLAVRETAIDTTTPHGRLTISILASIAQFERELILSPISEGRKRARQRLHNSLEGYRIDKDLVGREDARRASPEDLAANLPPCR